MELTVRARNFEVTPALRTYVERKFIRLTRHLPTTNLASAQVELTQQKTLSVDDRFVVQVTIEDIHGVTLRAQERGATANAVLDAAVDTMDRRLRQYKGRTYRSEQPHKAGKPTSLGMLEATVVEHNDAAAPIAEVEDADDDEGVATLGRVVRVKRFPVKPMSLEDAAFQMEMLGHSFFLFFNSEVDQYHVLYKRNDGDYGLIEPAAA